MSERLFGCPNTEPQHMMEKWESWEKGILVCECGKRFQMIDCKIVPIETEPVPKSEWKTDMTIQERILEIRTTPAGDDFYMHIDVIETEIDILNKALELMASHGLRGNDPIDACPCPLLWGTFHCINTVCVQCWIDHFRAETTKELEKEEE